MFLNALDDDRSDNDDNEFLEEQRLDALSKEGIDSVAAPKVLINGQSMNGSGNSKSTSTKLRTNAVTNRKENAKKS